MTDDLLKALLTYFSVAILTDAGTFSRLFVKKMA